MGGGGGRREIGEGRREGRERGGRGRGGREGRGREGEGGEVKQESHTYYCHTHKHTYVRTYCHTEGTHIRTVAHQHILSTATGG